MTPEEIFKEMPANLNADAAKGMNSTIQFNLAGDSGGQWYVTIKDGKAQVTKGTASSPNMTLSMSASDYVDMIVGKLNGQMAFTSGKLKISGDMGLAMKMQSLFKRPAWSHLVAEGAAVEGWLRRTFGGAADPEASG